MALHINHLAVWIAAAIYFVIGGLWYAPFLFGKQWMALNRMSDEARRANLKAKGGMGVFLGLSFAGGVISVYVLACLLSAMSVTSVSGGALAGLTISWALYFIPTYISNLFAMRPFRLTLIDGGYVVVALTVAGAILSALAANA